MFKAHTNPLFYFLTELLVRKIYSEILNDVIFNRYNTPSITFLFFYRNLFYKRIICSLFILIQN